MTYPKSRKKSETDALPSPHIQVEAAKHPPDNTFPIVGIGASAGGLAAFEAFFSGLPVDSDPGMAFVLVQHLAPNHKSILTDLVRRFTRMAVHEVDDGMAVRPNCVYIIPPNYDMAFLNGTLQLLEPTAPRGHRLPIDFLFRSLAQDQRELAIGIILSGTGSDGTLGVRAIKGEGGMIMAQNPESCEFDGMPRSAISTGLVDYELPPAEMPAQLAAYATYAYGKLPRHITEHSPKSEGTLKKLYLLMRNQTGHDFSEYKPSTVNRRIARRMAVHQIDGIENYLKYMQQTPVEVEALFRDLLIGVTQFFRDPEAFAVLEKEIIPGLFAAKSPGASIRAWSTGCSTGEEAYSIAILLQERMDVLTESYTLQVFATDIDARAISTARAGLYPASIAAHISPERLERFFTATADGSAYRVNKSLRDLLIFSEQDLIKDPPFSRIDLISCRNLLIYLNAELQKKIIPLFHYALNPGGVLLLGTSEGVGEANELFSARDRKAKLFQRKDEHKGAPSASILPTLRATDSVAVLNGTPRGARTPVLVTLPLRELTEQALLKQLVPAAALVNGHGDILYLHGRSGMFLEPAPGETGISNILQMAREGLRPDLAMALQKAIATDEQVRCLGVNVKTNGHFTRVNLCVGPLSRGAARMAELLNSPKVPLYLVILEEALGFETEAMLPADLPDLTDARNTDFEAAIAALKDELHAKDEYLHSTHEELESANEQLKSANEEMQSVNEELQSTNEELETSKEELQSVNEELSTVNNELQTKVHDLSRSNNDMNNLLAGTGIGTVFVDHQLRILRFTPAASTIINLILSDVGRPVAHMASNLVGYATLVSDIQAVLDTLIAKQVEVQTATGEWYTVHIQPYRTLENVIEGAVIAFVNITETVRIRDALESANKQMRLAVVVRDAHDAITVQDLHGRILAWNPGAERIYGWSEAEALLMNVRDLIPEGLREKALSRVNQLSQAEILEPFQTQRFTKAGSLVDIWMTATALINEAGHMYAISTTERVGESIDKSRTQTRKSG
jgi:two-component system CheB/CheR fusion protein